VVWGILFGAAKISEIAKYNCAFELFISELGSTSGSAKCDVRFFFFMTKSQTTLLRFYYPDQHTTTNTNNNNNNKHTTHIHIYI
jgi:hypothetical protein